MTDSDQVVGLTETISVITDRSDSIRNVLDEQTEATG
tara:strand:+ start:236 stop:346 length:111 start_codon:yes stop_codon:yes gene_type:complete